MAQAKYYVLLFLVCLIWGATPASGKFTVDAFSPLMITGMRFALIALVLFAWLFLTRDKKSLRPPKDVLIVTFFMGVMGILVHNGLLFTGLNYTTATNTALIESIGPTATTLLAFLFLGERLNPLGWVGIAVSCVGALTIVTKGSISVLINLSFNIGDILILICEVAWSCYVVISWRIHGRLGTIGVTAWSGLFGSLLCFAVGGVTGTLHVYEVGTKALLGFAYLVIFSGIFAFVAWNFAVQQVGASKAGVFVYIVPLTGGLFGVLLLGEPLHYSQLVGAALILSGVVVTVKAKVKIREEKKAESGSASEEKDLLKKFPELAEAHNAKLAADGVTLTKLHGEKAAEMSAIAAIMAEDVASAEYEPVAAKPVVSDEVKSEPEPEKAQS